MVRHTRRVALSVGVALFASIVACGEDVIPLAPVVPDEPDPVVVPGASSADVNALFQTFPSWEEYSVPLSDEEVVAPEPAFYEQNADLFCSVTEASITRNPEDIVTYSPDSEILWLGSLIQGKGHKDGLGSLLELPIRQRAPLTIAIDILFSENTRTVESPTLGSVGQAIGQLIDQADEAEHEHGSSIFFSQVENHSLEQSALALGLSAAYMGVSVRSSLEMERTSSSSSLTATFIQKMFTTSVVLPQSPQDVFSDEFTEELLQDQFDRGNIGPNNLPVYVASITWGRMLTVTMTSEHSAAEMKAALQASSAFVDFDADAEHKKVLDDSEIKVVAIGGHAQAAIDLIRTGRLDEFFKEDAPLTTARPISYVLRNLGDNTIAKVSETTEYAIRECEPGGVQRYYTYTAWRDAVGAAGLVEDSLLTYEANVALASGLALPLGGNRNIGPRATWLADSTGLPFSFYLENTNGPELETPYQQSWTLVFRDQEFWGGADRYISIGDVDGIPDVNRYWYENDDFDIRVIVDDSTASGASVYAIGITVADNSASTEESIIVRGEGFDVVLDEYWNGFVGLVAPFPIINVHFNEDGGGDDIAIRDFRFGSN